MYSKFTETIHSKVIKRTVKAIVSKEELVDYLLKREKKSYTAQAGTIEIDLDDNDNNVVLEFTAEEPIK